MNTKVPQKISYVVVIHAGSYKNYEKELKKKFPTIVQKFSKRVGIHYYIEQLENESEPKISLKDLYTLPIMGIREELSTYAFFKSTKTYNNVLIRLCDSKHDKDAQYQLVQLMLTPFEKSYYCFSTGHSRISYTEENIERKTKKTYFINTEDDYSFDNMDKLFNINEFDVLEQHFSFKELVKKLTWEVGIVKK